MQPKTKLQKEIFALSAKLPNITKEQEEYAYNNCFEHRGYKCKNVVYCMDCGMSWDDKQPPLLTTLDGCTCPNCKSKLKITVSRKQKDRQEAYFCIVTTVKGYQVVRFFDVCAYYKRGEKPYYAIQEIVQRWLTPAGQHETIARSRSQFFASYNDSWCWTSPMEIRSKSSATCYNLLANVVYPRKKILPIIKRNGMQNGFHGLSPFRMFYLLLTDSKAETLMKAKQHSILKYYVDHNWKINNYWASIKICLRNKYKVSDASIYFDYLDLLLYFKKDLHNAKYVCPRNMKKEHDKLSARKHAILEREYQIRQQQAEENRKLKAIEDEQKFLEMRKKFFGLEFSDGKITVKVLESIQEFLEESNTMKHCVFSGQYYLKSDSLILSASLDDKKLETVEISLKSLTVVQCRGKHNNNTEYHEDILSLVNKNIPLIRKRIRKKEKDKMTA